MRLNDVKNKFVTLIKSIAFFISIFLIAGLVADGVSRILTNTEEYRILLVIILQGILFVSLWYLILERISNTDIVTELIDNIQLDNKSTKLGISYGLLSITIGLIVVAIVNVLFELPREHNDMIADIISNDPIMLIVVLILNLLFVAVSEEILFRGGVYEILKTDYSKLTAGILSATFFGVLHVQTFNLDITAITSALLPAIGGLIYVYTYEKYDNIIIPIVAHATNNIIVFILVYLYGM